MVIWLESPFTNAWRPKLDGNSETNDVRIDRRWRHRWGVYRGSNLQK